MSKWQKAASSRSRWTVTLPLTHASTPSPMLPNKTATKEVTPLVPVLAAVSGESEKTVELQFNKPESTTYSGTYSGTVTFTVSVDNKS